MLATKALVEWMSGWFWISCKQCTQGIFFIVVLCFLKKSCTFSYVAVIQLQNLMFKQNIALPCPWKKISFLINMKSPHPQNKKTVLFRREVRHLSITRPSMERMYKALMNQIGMDHCGKKLLQITRFVILFIERGKEGKTENYSEVLFCFI